MVCLLVFPYPVTNMSDIEGPGRIAGNERYRADQPFGLGFRISSDFQRSHSRSDQTIKRPQTRCLISGKIATQRETVPGVALSFKQTRLVLAKEYSASTTAQGTVSPLY